MNQYKVTQQTSEVTGQSASFLAPELHNYPWKYFTGMWTGVSLRRKKLNRHSVPWDGMATNYYQDSPFSIVKKTMVMIIFQVLTYSHFPSSICIWTSFTVQIQYWGIKWWQGGEGFRPISSSILRQMLRYLIPGKLLAKLNRMEIS